MSSPTPDATPIIWDASARCLTARFEGSLRFGQTEHVERMLTEACEAHRPDVFRLDCTGIDHVDSHGLAFILSLQEQVRRLGGRFVLAHPGEHLCLLLKMTRLETLLEVERGEA